MQSLEDHIGAHGVDFETSDNVGDLVPDPVVWREFDISSMTGWRWSHDPELGFPPAIKIRNRNFRSRQQLDRFKSCLLKQALAEPAS